MSQIKKVDTLYAVIEEFEYSEREGICSILLGESIQPLVISNLGLYCEIKKLIPELIKSGRKVRFAKFVEVKE